MNDFKKHLFLLVFSSLFCITYAFADCQIDNTADPSGATLSTGSKVLTYGQVFKACDDGVVYAITINTDGGDIQLFLAKGDGTTLDLSTPYETFAGSAAGDVTLNLTNPFSVENGEKYAFAIGNVDGVLFDWNPDNMDDGQNAFRYSGGVFTAQPNNDLYYAVNIKFTPIPTLSTWGLLLLGLLLLNLSIYFIHNLVLLKKE